MFVCVCEHKCNVTVISVSDGTRITIIAVAAAPEQACRDRAGAGQRGGQQSGGQGTVAGADGPADGGALASQPAGAVQPGAPSTPVPSGARRGKISPTGTS